MKRIRWVLLVLGTLLVGLVGTSHGYVTYQAIAGGAGDWTYEYFVTNEYTDYLVDFSVSFPVSGEFFLFDPVAPTSWISQKARWCNVMLPATSAPGPSPPP